MGNDALAERYFRQAAEIDLANNMGNAAGGIHAAAMGGLWQAAVFGFAGVSLTQEMPDTRPSLPPGWRSLKTRVQWHGQWQELSFAQGISESRNEEGTP